MAELSEGSLQTQLQQAMKARDTLRVSVLRGIISGIKNAKVEQRGSALTAEQITAIVRRELKKRDEAIEFARQGRRDDVLQQNEAERALLSALLPTPLTAAELEAAVRRLREEGAGALGEVMRRLQGEFPGRVDGRQASEIARRVLAETAAP